MGFMSWLGSTVGHIPIVGDLLNAGEQALSGAGFGPAPNAWDTWKEDTDIPFQSARDLYKVALVKGAQVGEGPQIGNITAQQIATPNAISVENVSASPLLAGAEADALRAQQLSQSAEAASSPSSAAAQMRAAGAQIQSQQMGMAAAARGQNRAAARRDAMISTGNLGLQAANQTAALAAQEQAAKQQAYSDALARIRSGDVSAASTLAQIGAQNQQAQIQAQTTTGAQRLAAAQSNQSANLQQQIQQQQNVLNAWDMKNKAIQSYLGLANQSLGTENQSLRIRGDYAESLNKAQQEQNAAAASTTTSFLGYLFGSDEKLKEDVSLWGDDDKATAAERVSKMTADDLIDWADQTQLATFKYRDDVDKIGGRYNIGVPSAQDLERSGPIGEMLVNETEDGTKWVDYPKLAFLVGKAALEKTNRIEDMYDRLVKEVRAANQRRNRKV